MHIPLDRHSVIPLYLQIEETLRCAILDGSLKEGDKLPSTRMLAAELAISRLTVENAYGELAAKGFLEARRGSGAYVRHPYAPPAHTTGRPTPFDDGAFPVDPFTTGASRLDGHADTPLPPEVINFAAGIGNPRIFPQEAFRKVMHSVLRRHADEAFHYGDYCGYYPLRDTLARILSLQGIPARPEQILITNGSQQALSLVSQTLLRPGDTVLVEEPTYAEALTLFALQGIRTVPIPCDADGLCTDALPALLAAHRPALIYTIPNFQNPTGRCLSEPRRRQLVALAAAAGVTLLEDDFVGDLRYEGAALPSLRSLATGGGVIYIGTFSKMLMPSIRIGYLVADAVLYPRLAQRKHLDSFTTSSLLQRSLDAFVTVGSYQRQLQRACRLYRRLRDVAAEALARHLPEGCRMELPAGGLFLWLQLPPDIPVSRLMPLAWQEKVTFARGACFYRDNPQAEFTLRLNFSANTPERTLAGIERLARAMALCRAQSRHPGHTVESAAAENGDGVSNRPPPMI